MSSKLTMEQVFGKFEKNPNKFTAYGVLVWIAQTHDAFYRMNESEKELHNLARKIYTSAWTMRDCRDKFAVTSNDDGQWTIVDRDSGTVLSDYSLSLSAANRLVVKLNDAWNAAPWE